MLLRTKEYNMPETTKDFGEIVKLCPIKQDAAGRECDKEKCTWYENQHRQCMVVIFLRAGASKGH